MLKKKECSKHPSPDNSRYLGKRKAGKAAKISVALLLPSTPAYAPATTQNTEKSPQTMDIVASLPESHLRVILIALCNDPHTHARVISMASKLVAAPSSCNGSDQAICVQCDQAFSVLTRAENSCRYHPGKFEQWGGGREREG
ncbi:hypothetical protein BBO_06750 [Beauveria brongniartii RCEF 3172]|uniref:C2H2-type domain-containing protein n=1 Tax=Beauveria brongniartii RCEF 3172 TaxID=1081107 RepID=A0A167ATZ2_9HYPO|nr:hypothetical protein BBO_06750 [Beauveria brongniartii RCEF 3172]